MPPLKRKIGYSICALLLLTSCSSLKFVSQYGSSATASLQSFQKINYSFTAACNDKCLLEQLDKQQLLNEDCNCTLDNKADSVTLIIFNAIQQYLDGLGKLADNKLTNYNFEQLSKNLSAGQFGGVSVSQSQATAYQKITSTLTKAFADQFRRKKLSTYIATANQPLHVLIDALQLNLTSNLLGRLFTQKQRLKTYMFDLLQTPSISAVEKKQIIEQYNELTTKMNLKQQQIIAFGQQLDIIAKGHEALYNNKNQLIDKNKTLVASMASCTTLLTTLIAEFNSFKTL